MAERQQHQEQHHRHIQDTVHDAQRLKAASMFKTTMLDPTKRRFNEEDWAEAVKGVPASLGFGHNHPLFSTYLSEVPNKPFSELMSDEAEAAKATGQPAPSVKEMTTTAKQDA